MVVECGMGGGGVWGGWSVECEVVRKKGNYILAMT